MEITIDIDDAAINWNASGPDRIAQNVLNICRTLRHEVAYKRTMGIDPGFLHKPLPEAQAEITAQITEQVALYEPRARIRQVLFGGTDTSGDMTFKVVIAL